MWQKRSMGRQEKGAAAIAGQGLGIEKSARVPAGEPQEECPEENVKKG